MNSDIRVDTRFAESAKLCRLEAVLGPSAGWHLIRLWSWCAVHHPTGDLTGIPDHRIATAAGWPGDPSELVKTLVEHRWIDRNGVSLTVHHWKEHQSYVYHAPDRKRAAQAANEARWGKKRATSKAKGQKKLIRPGIRFRSDPESGMVSDPESPGSGSVRGERRGGVCNVGGDTTTARAKPAASHPPLGGNGSRPGSDPDSDPDQALEQSIAALEAPPPVDPIPYRPSKRLQPGVQEWLDRPKGTKP